MLPTRPATRLKACGLAASLALLFAAAAPSSAAFQQAGARPGLALQTSHATEVTAVACAPDGRTLATGGDDGRIKLWDARSGELRWTVKAHRGPAGGVAFTPDGRLVVSAGWDMTVKLWDARSGESAGSLPNPGRVGFEALAVSPDGKVFAAAGTGGEDSPTADEFEGRILIWDAATRTLRQTIKEGGREVSALAFSPDGLTLASGGADTNLKVWQVSTGTLLATHAGHGDEITSVAYSLNGSSLLASGSRDGTVKVRDASTGALKLTLPGEAGERNHVAFSRADGSLLVGNSSFKFFNASSGGLLRTLEPAMLRTTALVVSDDGLLAVGVGLASVPDDTPNSDVPLFDQAHVWDARGGKFLRRMSGYPAGVVSVASSPAGLLAAAGFDRAVRVWDTRAGRVLRAMFQPSAVWAVALSPDAKTLAIATGDMTRPGEVFTCDVATGLNAKRLKGHTLPARAVAFSPDGQTLASGGEDGAVILWNPEAGESLRKLAGGNRPVLALAFSPDGRTLATGSFDHKVRLWDVTTGALLKTLTGHAESVFAVAFSPDGRTLASGSKDRRVRLWDVETGANVSTLDTLALRVTSLAFLDGGAKLAAANDDGGVTVWEMTTGSLLRTFAGHELGVNSLSPAGGALVYSGGADGTVRLWDASTGEARATLYSLRPGETETRTPGAPSGEGYFPPEPMRTDFVVTTPEGYYAATTRAERLARFRVGRDLFPAENFQGPYNRPDLVRRALAGQATPHGPDLAGPLPPLVGFTSHRDGDTFSGGALDLALVATDDVQIKRVTIFLDGVPVKPALLKLAAPAPVPAGLTLGPRGLPDSHRVSQTVTAHVTLPARKKTFSLRAVVVDNSGLQSRTDDLKLTRK